MAFRAVSPHAGCGFFILGVMGDFFFFIVPGTFHLLEQEIPGLL
jgi:hypothetical protein